MGLPRGPLGGGKTPAKPRSRHQYERQGEAVTLTDVGAVVGGEWEAKGRKFQEDKKEMS